MSRELFGTDGVRGVAGEYPLDEAGARAIGRAVGSHFARAGESIVIGWDPRESSVPIVEAICEGLAGVGIEVVRAGVLPTPGLAYVTGMNTEFVAGIMVTASHNPYQYNGVKVFDDKGGKLSDDTEAVLNKLIVEGVADRQSGKIIDNPSFVTSYQDFLIGSAQGLDLKGVTVAVDSANGAASGLAASVFAGLGATVHSLSDQPDGRNINDGCGATDTAMLRSYVTDNKLDLGIAVDGDADRLIMVDGQGREVKGDHLMYILAVARQEQGVVATVMSNLGFELALTKLGIALERTHVGDRYVLEGLEKTGYKLGGEQSGHIILPDLLGTGDGLLAAVQVLKALKGSGKSLAAWYEEIELLPQALVNVTLADKALLDKPEVRQFIDDQNRQLANEGRLLIRPSGTEPLVRVMVEAPNAETTAKEIADKLQELLV